MTDTVRPAVTLSKGSHADEFDGTDDCPRCLFEAYNWLQRRDFSDDCPPGVSPVLHTFGMQLNDCLDDTARQALVRYLPNGDDPLAGTAGDGRDEARGYMALDWLIRTYLLRWLELVPALEVHAASVRKLRRIDGMKAAEEAGVIVRAARSAAWAAAGDAAWAAAWAAARSAARDAAGAAARDKLNPVVVILQESAIALYDQMIKGTWE